MGLKTWYKNQNERNKAYKAERRAGITGFYGEYLLQKGQLMWNFHRNKRPIAGASAVAESGSSAKSPTLTRVVAGGILAGPAGAIVGGLFQKNKSRFYVTVTFADESVVIIDGPSKDETQLRKFAERINAASRHYAE